MSARRADLRDAVFGENSLRELRARLVLPPRPELGLTEPIDPHAVTSDTVLTCISRKAVVRYKLAVYLPFLNPRSFGSLWQGLTETTIWFEKFAVLSKFAQP